MILEELEVGSYYKAFGITSALHHHQTGLVSLFSNKGAQGSPVNICVFTEQNKKPTQLNEKENLVCTLEHEIKTKIKNTQNKWYHFNKDETCKGILTRDEIYDHYCRVGFLEELTILKSNKNNEDSKNFTIFVDSNYPFTEILQPDLFSVASHKPSKDKTNFDLYISKNFSNNLIFEDLKSFLNYYYDTFLGELNYK